MAGKWTPIGRISGRDGVGVPDGGVDGQVLRKVGSSSFSTAWGELSYNDIDGKVPASALPEITTAPFVVDSEAQMLNLPAVPGRMAVRTDIGETYILADEPASVLSNWVKLETGSAVTSVAGKTGAVTLTKADVGLGNVSNTADPDKPVATASVNGLMSKADKAKLDKATANDTTSTVMMRDGSGTTSLKRLILNAAPSASGDATSKAYVDGEVAKRLAGMTALGTEDLNTVIAEGLYAKIGAPDIRNPDLHYPSDSAGAGVLLVTRYGADRAVQEWTDHAGPRRWLRATYNSGANWTPWRELAGTELATSAKAGLMSGEDKAKVAALPAQSAASGALTQNTDLDTLITPGIYAQGDSSSVTAALNWPTAASGNGPFEVIVSGTGNTCVQTVDIDGARWRRNRVTYWVPGAGTVYSWRDWRKIAAPGYIGGSKRTDYGWNSLKDATGVYEGFPKGTPIGDTPVDTMSRGFVADPVWKLTSRDEGLNYVTQRAELLNCVPKFMVGFVWERTYNPASSTWTPWRCVGGDTGPIASVQQKVVATLTPEEPLVHASGRLYNDSIPYIVQRIGGTVYLSGAGKTVNDSAIQSNEGRSLGWFAPKSETSASVPGVDFTLLPPPDLIYAASGIQQGSGKNHWNVFWSSGSTFNASRYGPDTNAGSSTVWLPFDVRYPAPPVGTNR